MFNRTADTGGSIAIKGDRMFEVTRGGRNGDDERPKRERIIDLLRAVLPSRDEPAEVNRYRIKNLPNIMRGLRQLMLARLFRIGHSFGTLSATLTRGDGTVVDYGVVSYRVVTTAGRDYLVDAMQNLTEPENFKYHGYGTGTTAEAAGDTALVTELGTQYNPNSTRPTGSQTESGGGAYRTVATLTPDSGGVIAVTEHGIFSQAATGGGVLLDRSVFAAMNLDSANGDNLQTTYDLTIPAGG